MKSFCQFTSYVFPLVLGLTAFLILGYALPAYISLCLCQNVLCFWSDSMYLPFFYSSSIQVYVLRDTALVIVDCMTNCMSTVVSYWFLIGELNFGMVRLLTRLIVCDWMDRSIIHIECFVSLFFVFLPLYNFSIHIGICMLMFYYYPSGRIIRAWWDVKGIVVLKNLQSCKG